MNNGGHYILLHIVLFIAMDPMASAAQFLASAKACAAKRTIEEVHPAAVPGKTTPGSGGANWYALNPHKQLISAIPCTYNFGMSAVHGKQKLLLHVPDLFYYVVFLINRAACRQES